jgi:hypothetical protein
LYRVVAFAVNGGCLGKERTTTMTPKEEDFICFYREAVITGHDNPAAQTMRRFNLSRDYTVRLLNQAIARCEGLDIRNWNRRIIPSR